MCLPTCADIFLLEKMKVFSSVFFGKRFLRLYARLGVLRGCVSRETFCGPF